MTKCLKCGGEEHIVNYNIENHKLYIFCFNCSIMWIKDITKFKEVRI